MGVDEEQLRKEATKRITMRRAFWQHLASYVIVNVALIGVWAITGAATSGRRGSLVDGGSAWCSTR